MLLLVAAERIKQDKILLIHPAITLGSALLLPVRMAKTAEMVVIGMGTSVAMLLIYQTGETSVMSDDVVHPLIIALISAAAQRDPAARVVVVRLLAALCEIARELDEVDRAEISSIMHTAALELEEKPYSNGHRFDFRCPSTREKRILGENIRQ